MLQTYILPWLPMALYHLAYPKQPKHHGGSFPELISMGSALGTSGSDVLTISGLASATGASVLQQQLAGLQCQIPGAPTGRGTFISNLHPIAMVVVLDKPNLKIRDIIGMTQLPMMNNGSDMCLSYHLRGGCWSNCRRATHHGQSLGPDEVQCLQQYLTQRFTQLTPQTLHPGAATNPVAGVPPPRAGASSVPGVPP
jgi:hypothetical protein